MLGFLYLKTTGHRRIMDFMDPSIHSSPATVVQACIACHGGQRGRKSLLFHTRDKYYEVGPQDRRVFRIFYSFSIIVSLTLWTIWFRTPNFHWHEWLLLVHASRHSQDMVCIEARLLFKVGPLRVLKRSLIEAVCGQPAVRIFLVPREDISNHSPRSEKITIIV